VLCQIIYRGYKYIKCEREKMWRIKELFEKFLLLTAGMCLLIMAIMVWLMLFGGIYYLVVYIIR